MMRNCLIIVGWLLLLIPQAFGVAAAMGGTPSLINSVSVTWTTPIIAQVGNAMTDKQVCLFTVSNNDPNGFTLSFTSGNNSQMKRVGAPVTPANGDFLPYTFKLGETINGTHGAQTANTLGPYVLSSTAARIFSYNIMTMPSINAEFKIMITTTTKSLFNGTFQDTITVRISNL